MSNRQAAPTPRPAEPASLLGAAADFQHLDPHSIVRQALRYATRPLLSTNFRPRAAALLHLVTRIVPDIPVVWVDSGYNTPATYRFAEEVTQRLNLNLKVYTPLVSSARRTAVLGGVPGLDDPGHEAFTQEVKLEPFERALRELAPDLWFTGIRAEQTAFRKTLGVVSRGPFGTTRVAPFFALTGLDLEDYLYEHDLPDNDDYFDETKVLERRECGLQNLGSGI